MNIHAASIVASLVAIAACTAGCATETGPSGEETEATRDALTIDPVDPVDPSAGGTAEKPKNTVSNCIVWVRVLNPAWTYDHAKAYCVCRSQGKTDDVCTGTIPYIDL